MRRRESPVGRWDRVRAALRNEGGDEDTPRRLRRLEEAEDEEETPRHRSNRLRRLEEEEDEQRRPSPSRLRRRRRVDEDDDEDRERRIRMLRRLRERDDEDEDDEGRLRASIRRRASRRLDEDYQERRARLLRARDRFDESDDDDDYDRSRDVAESTFVGYTDTEDEHYVMDVDHYYDDDYERDEDDAPEWAQNLDLDDFEEDAAYDIAYISEGARPRRIMKMMGGKKVKTWDCPEGFKEVRKKGEGPSSRPQCVKLSGTEKRALSKRAKKAARKPRNTAAMARKAARTRKKTGN